MSTPGPEQSGGTNTNLDLQNFFIGLMDFFCILLPGALLTWLLMGEVGPAVLGDRYAALAGAQAWAAFLFVSYLFGHLVFLLGSWLDELYDWARRYTLNAQITGLTRRGRLLPWLARALIWLVFKRERDLTVERAGKIKQQALALLQAMDTMKAFLVVLHARFEQGRRVMTKTNPDEPIATSSAVINPYALAEVVSGRRIKWKEVKDAPRLLESILQTPYEELFDPKHDGPLYFGFRLNEQMQLEPARASLLDIEIKVEANDLEVPLDTVAVIERLADLGPRYKVEQVGSIPVQRAEVVGNQLHLALRLPSQDRLQKLARVFPKSVLAKIAPDPGTVGKSSDWTPPDATWGDAGRFFNETFEFFDPIQGAVANCYFIAALSAVAWAMPFRIWHLTRATGQSQEAFTNLIQFFKPDSGGQLDKEIEVTDTVPLNVGGGFLYARSSEAGEIWPAVYEKAYAKLKTGTTSDHPDILSTAWGDCVWATAQLTGGQREYHNTADNTADKLWDIVRANFLGGRTFNPMTAWTYSSGDAAPKKVVYADANVVGSHCYTILGWDYRDGRKYIILRNPWGNTEATVQNLAGTTWLWDISWWRPIDLAVVDGTFAVEASAFKQYWAGLGVVK